MIRCLVASLVLSMFAVASAPVRAHDVYRFVGPVIKWDAAKHTLDMYGDDTGDKVLHIVLREDCKVTWAGQEVPRSTFRKGLWVKVDAVGVDLDDIEGTEIEIVSPKPKGK